MFLASKTFLPIIHGISFILWIMHLQEVYSDQSQPSFYMLRALPNNMPKAPVMHKAYLNRLAPTSTQISFRKHPTPVNRPTHASNKLPNSYSQSFSNQYKSLTPNYKLLQRYAHQTKPHITNHYEPWNPHKKTHHEPSLNPHKTTHHDAPAKISSKEFNHLKYAVHHLVNEVARVAMELVSQKTELDATLAQLRADIAANANSKDCPNFSREIGSKCYYVGITPVDFNEAKSICASLGGKLAEPAPNLADVASFVEMIILKFPLEVTTITELITTPVTGVWLGITEIGTSNNFEYLQSATTLASTDPILVNTGGTAESIALQLSGSNKYLFSADNLDSDRPPLCEINPI